MFIFKVAKKTIKLKKKWFQVKDTEKSSSRKLERGIYYIFYRLLSHSRPPGPQKLGKRPENQTNTGTYNKKYT